MNKLTYTIPENMLETVILDLNQRGYYVIQGRPQGDRITIVAVKCLRIGDE